MTKNSMLGEGNGDIWYLPLLLPRYLLEDGYEGKMCGSIDWEAL